MTYAFTLISKNSNEQIKADLNHFLFGKIYEYKGTFKITVEKK